MITFRAIRNDNFSMFLSVYHIIMSYSQPPQHWSLDAGANILTNLSQLQTLIITILEDDKSKGGGWQDQTLTK
jgi:hypothetical protein